MEETKNSFFKGYDFNGKSVRELHAEIIASKGFKIQPEVQIKPVTNIDKPSNPDLAEFLEFCNIICGVIKFLVELNDRHITAQQELEAKQKHTVENNLVKTNLDVIHEGTSVKDRFFTIAQIMEVFQISRKTIYAWKDSGFLVPIKIGGRVLYPKSNVIAILNKNNA